MPQNDSVIRWLHLTDLHMGMGDQDWLWPNMKAKFHEDLKKIYDDAGPWDLVLFTGDLAQRGSPAEYQKLDEAFGSIWSWFKDLGCEPKLLAVPGNHDLNRPSEIKDRPILNALEKWHQEDEAQKYLWDTSDSNPYIGLLKEAFKHYTDWWERSPYRPQSGLKTGYLPGDFSYTVQKGGLSLGIIGLNSAFLQLTGKNDYKGRLVIHPRQCNAVAPDGNCVEWAHDHDTCFLMSHHPMGWIHPDCSTTFFQEAMECFSVHLCGHRHETEVLQMMTGGAANAPIQWVGRSLFGLEKVAGEIEREHGYVAGTLSRIGDKPGVRFQPKKRESQGHQWALVPDHSVRLPDYQRTRVFPIEWFKKAVGHPAITADDSASSKKCVLTSNTDRTMNCHESVLDYQPKGEFPKRLSDYPKAEVFSIAGHQLDYFPIFGGSENGVSEFGKGDIVVEAKEEPYEIPQEFLTPEVQKDFPENSPGELKCRLETFYQKRTIYDYPDTPHFVFTPATYRDYGCTNHRIDSPCPNTNGKTYRDVFGRNWIASRQFEESRLSNVCGVGIFLITADNYIVITRHIPTLKVYPGAWSYSASGTMDWRFKGNRKTVFDPDYTPNPFDDAIRECEEEIAHVPSIEHTYLMGFGIDANMLFIQFSFYEKTFKRFNEIKERANTAKHYAAEVYALEGIPFDLDSVVNVLLDGRDWEPSAAANLFRLCEKKFGTEAVARKLVDKKMLKKRSREVAQTEWQNRARRKLKLARVMSLRYPTHELEFLSDNYVGRVKDLIKEEIADKNVLEIGCGIGRFTGYLNDHASSVTCLDFLSEMIGITKQTLPDGHRVDFIQSYVQDYRYKTRHDVAFCSLVLVHLREQWDFNEAVHAIADSAETVLLFEHADETAEVTSASNRRSERELIEAFENMSFVLKKKTSFFLDEDKITFLKLCRSRESI